MILKSRLLWISAFGVLLGFQPAIQLAQTPQDDHERQAALSFEEQGETAQAQAAWLAVLKSHPADAEAYAHLGFLEARQEHYSEAVSYYRKASQLDSAMPGLELNLGLSLFKGGRLKEAADVFTSLLKSQPQGSSEALRLTTLIGLADYGAGEYTAAVPYLKQATTVDPQNLPFRLTLAHSCLRSEQYQCVLDVYKEILTLNAESAEADMLAGEALDEMKDKPGAIAQFRAAVKADPKMPEVHFGLGYLLWSQFQVDEAAKEFQAELENNPNHPQALTYLADSEMRLNHPEPAMVLLEKAIAIDSKIQLAHLDLGTLYIDAGRNDDALRELKIAEQLDPNDQNVHFRLGRFYKSLGRNDEANAEFEKTKSLQKARDESLAKKLQPSETSTRPEAVKAGVPPSN
jgi:tetratricopeptide (TPR) repeat protein